MTDTPTPPPWVKHADFVGITFGDGQGAVLLRGWVDLCRYFIECHYHNPNAEQRAECMARLTDWKEWSNTGDGTPYYLHCPYENGSMAVVRLTDASPYMPDERSTAEPDKRADHQKKIDALRYALGCIDTRDPALHRLLAEHNMVVTSVNGGYSPWKPDGAFPSKDYPTIGEPDEAMVTRIAKALYGDVWFSNRLQPRLGDLKEITRKVLALAAVAAPASKGDGTRHRRESTDGSRG